MKTFAVKRTLTGISMEELGNAQKLAIETSEQITNEGIPVSYIRSNFFPTDSTCICLFSSELAETVARVNDEAAIPYDDITEVIDLPKP